MDIKGQLKEYLLSEVAVDLGKEDLSDDDDLLELGIIDSMGIVSLISFMEEKFDISIEDEEIVPDNFQSLRSMEKFIEQKK